MSVSIVTQVSKVIGVKPACKICRNQYIAVPKNLYMKMRTLPLNWIPCVVEEFDKISTGCGCACPAIEEGQYIIVDHQFRERIEGRLSGSNWMSPPVGKKKVGGLVLKGSFTNGELHGRGRVLKKRTDDLQQHAETAQYAENIKYHTLFSGEFVNGRPHGFCLSDFCPDCEHGNIWYQGMHILEAGELDISEGCVKLTRKQQVAFMTFAVRDGQFSGPYQLYGVFDPETNEFERTEVWNETERVGFGNFAIDFSSDPLSWVDFVPTGSYELLSAEGNVCVRFTDSQHDVVVSYADGSVKVGGDRLTNLDQLLNQPCVQPQNPLRWLILYEGGARAVRHGYFPWETDVVFDGEGRWYVGEERLKFQGLVVDNKPRSGKMFNVNMSKFMSDDQDAFRDCVLEGEFDEMLRPVGAAVVQTSSGKKTECVWTMKEGVPVPKFSRPESTD